MATWLVPTRCLTCKPQLTPNWCLLPRSLKMAKSAKPAKPAAQAMQAKVSARIQPWQQQPVISATGDWRSLDLAALWPQAPQTQLDGDAKLTPSGKGWRADLRLANSQAGPWNQQRVPVQALNAKLVFELGQWTLESLQASAAGGRIEAQGKLVAAQSTGAQSAQVSGWQGQARLVGVNPAAIDSRLAAGLLNGQLSAQQTATGIAFDATLQAAGARARPITRRCARGVPLARIC